MKDSMKKNILIKIKNLNNWLKNYVANFKASNYLKAYLGISFVLIIIFLLYLILDNYGILDKISSPEELQKIIQSKYHFVSALVYFAIQFLQVSVLPIPAMVTTAAGVFVFGNWYEALRPSKTYGKIPYHHSCSAPFHKQALLHIRMH